MDFGSLVEGPFLKITFWVFLIGILGRLVFFVSSIIKNRKDILAKGNNVFVVFARFLVPFHRAAPRKPIYSSLRYIFHICLFAAPIGFAGHIILWEESSLGWSWSQLPDAWADGMTLLLLALAAVFVIRHIAFKDVRMNSSPLDYIIIVLVAFPFMTGYFLAHDTLNTIPFFSAHLWTMHILSGEIMILMVLFLFLRTRMNPARCTGCASCELACPTGTIQSQDQGNTRTFNYSHYQCISCGSCVNICPENAATLRHEISLKNIFQIFTKRAIRTVEMETCSKCGSPFVPEPLMEKIEKNFAQDYLHYCPTCRKTNIRDYLHRLSPGSRALKISQKRARLSSQ